MERFHQFPCKREAYPYGSGTVPHGTVPCKRGLNDSTPELFAHRMLFIDKRNFLTLDNESKAKRSRYTCFD